jgi:hypothetical protein
MAFSQKGDKPRTLEQLQWALKGNPSKEEKEKDRTIDEPAGIEYRSAKGQQPSAMELNRES